MFTALQPSVVARIEYLLFSLLTIFRAAVLSFDVHSHMLQ